MRSNLLPLKNVQSVLSMQGLVCRSPQLGSSSREEMYYPRDPIRWSTARAAPPRYPHVLLDVDILSLIPQARRTRLDGSQQHDGCVGDDNDLHKQGFAKPSKRRGRRGGAAAPRARAWCGLGGGVGGGSPPGKRGGALGLGFWPAPFALARMGL